MKELCAKNAEGNQVDDQTQNVNKLEMQVQLLQGELNDKDRKLKDMSNKLAEMARRFKQEKEAAQSLRQVYLPKLNDTKVF